MLILWTDTPRAGFEWSMAVQRYGQQTKMRGDTMRRLLMKTIGAGALLALGALTQTSAAPTQWAVNGHWYEVIATPGIAWSDADTAAGLSTYAGLSGYLATITSADEDAFVLGLIAQSGQYYAGGFQDAGETVANAGWKWVTGEAWGYANWAPGEPNDAYGPGSEQWLGIGWQGWSWNDEAALGNIAGYVVEYGAVPDPASSLMLLGIAISGLGLIARRPR